jgi:hypothetical protein
MANVQNLACIAFRPEALDVHDLSYLPKDQSLKFLLHLRENQSQIMW